MSSVKTEKESKAITSEIYENFKEILNMSIEYFPPFIGCILVSCSLRNVQCLPKTIVCLILNYIYHCNLQTNNLI